MKISASTLFIAALLLTGCSAFGVSTTTTPGISPTPDMCKPSNLPTAAFQVNNLMRQFDDYATLASNTQQTQLVQVIPAMQAIRRTAEDQPVPPCLKVLIGWQLSYMNATINTLLGFQSNARTDITQAGINEARQYHNQYNLELAHLLGWTVPPPSATPNVQTPNVTNTPATPKP
jgi:hypothetical protein